MTDRPTCETCAYYDAPRCRRRAPGTLRGQPNAGWENSVWPIVGPGDWCGEYVTAEIMEPEAVDTTPQTLGRPRPHGAT